MAFLRRYCSLRQLLQFTVVCVIAMASGAGTSWATKSTLRNIKSGTLANSASAPELDTAAGYVEPREQSKPVLTFKLSLMHRSSLSEPGRENQNRRGLMEELTIIDKRRIRNLQTSPVSAQDQIKARVRVISGASFSGNVGNYFAEMYIGTPGQRFLFIVDTGSDLVWIPCFLCRSSTCNVNSTMAINPNHNLVPNPNTLPVFLPKTSSSFNTISCPSEECNLVPPPPKSPACSLKSPTTCTYSYGYSDLSQTIGIMAHETLTLIPSSSGSHNFSVQLKNVAFGCGLNNTGPSISKRGSGVLGLGQGPISLPSQLGHLFDNKFSYCFTTFFHRKSNSSLIFGDVDQMGIELKSPIQYTSFAQNSFFPTYYYIQIQAIKVADKALPLPSSMWHFDKLGNGGAIIDSGTTLSFFTQPAYRKILQTFKHYTKYPLAAPTAGLELCFNVSKVDHKPLRFPRFSIVFKDGVTFRPPPKNYILKPTPDVRCLGILNSPSISILGNLIQQNYFVQYDRQSNRLGFAKAHC